VESTGGVGDGEPSGIDRIAMLLAKKIELQCYFILAILLV